METPKNEQFVVRLPEFDPDWVHRGELPPIRTVWDRLMG